MSKTLLTEGKKLVIEMTAFERQSLREFLFLFESQDKKELRLK